MFAAELDAPLARQLAAPLALGWALGLRRPWTVDGWRGFLRKLRASSSSAAGAIAAAQSIEGGPEPSRLQH